ncbi:sensor histidine kinase [Microbispora sp. H13382]|uniref:sensor histidine kinase n=1 Tax=Microbispora sp. H13382 TaxID=2729112 RepID=UPI0015FFCE57|nr:histidine kinase [Microbispora sp. H13382]
MWRKWGIRHRDRLVDAALAAAVLAFTIPTTLTGYSFSLWDGAPGGVEIVTGIVTAAAMLVRRRTPWPAVLASAACACVTGQVVPMILAVYSMTAEHRVRRWQYVALALTVVYFAVDYRNPHTDHSVYLNAVRALTLIYLPAMVGTWVYAYRRLIRELRLGVREREEIAASEERRKIAREMHDTVTHAVTAMVLNAGMARDATDPGEVDELTAVIEDKGVQALDELRQLLTVLRRENGDLAEDTEAIARLVGEARASGLQVDLHLDAPPGTLPRQVSHACYRLVQEGLSNVRKHAPDSRVRVSCEVSGDQVAVSVVDTPAHPRPGGRKVRAAPSLGGGYGLAGIRERVCLAQGRFFSGPTPEGGFVLAARIPLRGGRAAGPPITGRTDPPA